jgi:tryptophanyl-tRNA synthetase
MKKNILTGIKPTGTPHIGNYLGAIRPALKSMGDPNFNYKLFVADYHAHTLVKDAKTFQQYVYEIAATWLACGLDPQRVTFYLQVDVPELFELSWILACHTPKGDLNRAHAYKALVAENLENQTKDPDHGVNMGLFTYPLLMAADILLFDAHYVPVGKDQLQHLEMARSMASRINARYKKQVFVEPQPIIQSDVATVPGLDGRKMSKSYDNTIALFCSEKKLKKLINRITTDSSAPDAPKDPNNSLVFDYYKLFASQQETEAFRQRLLAGISWGEAKACLFEKMNQEIAPLRNTYDELIEDKDKIKRLLKEGAQKAQACAQEKMAMVRKTLMGY